MSEYAIELTGVSKSFRRRNIQVGGHTTFKTQLVDWLTRKKKKAPPRVLSVLRDIELKVPRGATLGVVGQFWLHRLRLRRSRLFEAKAAPADAPPASEAA